MLYKKKSDDFQEVTLFEEAEIMETREQAQEAAQVTSAPAEDVKAQAAADHAPEAKPAQLEDDPLAGDEIPPPARRKRGSGARARRFEILLAESEVRKRDALADAHCCTAAQLVRSLIMDQPLPGRELLLTLAELRRQGGLMKHLAGQLIESGKDEVAAELLALARSIHETARDVGRRYGSTNNQDS